MTSPLKFADTDGRGGSIAAESETQRCGPAVTVGRDDRTFDGCFLANHAQNLGIRLSSRLNRQQVESVIDTHRLLEIRELRELGHELCVVLWLEWVLVFELRHQ
ncbi:MAG: hypothetical protein QM784_06710 [Polyangiaceae bacterium]